MCVYKVKRGERGEEGSKEGEREGRSGHPTRFLPSPPPHSLQCKALRPWDSPGRSCSLRELTKRTGHRMPAGHCNRLGLSPEVEFKFNAKFRFPKGQD